MARTTKKNRSYVSFKWTKELIIFLSALAVAIILTIICLIPTSKERFMSEWSTAISNASGTALNEDHIFKYISLNDFIDAKSEASEDKPLIILYGSSTDSTTVSNISAIDTTAQNYDVERIYILKSDFVMTADEEDQDDKAKLEKYRDAIGYEKTDDIKTYCQLLVYTGEDSFAFSSKEAIDNADNVDGDFTKAMHYCFSKYSPKGKDAISIGK